MFKRLLANIGSPPDAARNAVAASAALSGFAPPTGGNPLLEYAHAHPDGRFMHKWSHYFDIYHRHLARFRGRNITMVEIGVFNGGSLPMWRDYLGPQARIVGVDVIPECAQFAEEGIDIVIGDQGDRGFLRELRQRYPCIDVLVDDGGHTMVQQIATFEELYAHLAPDGIYICEDLHTSYMPPFGGGLGKAGTFIEFSKHLIDKLNAGFIRDEALPGDDFTLTTNALHFYVSMLVVERQPRAAPVHLEFGNRAAIRVVGPAVSGT